MALTSVSAGKVSVLELEWRFYDDDIKELSIPEESMDEFLDAPKSKGAYSQFHGEYFLLYLL